MANSTDYTAVMTLQELFALPAGSQFIYRAHSSDPGIATILANDGTEMLLDWSDGDQYPVRIDDNEWLPESLPYMSVIEPPLPEPIMVRA